MILGLGFKARSGKDEIANYLIKEYNFKRIAFADSLKEACRHIFRFTNEQLYGNQKEIMDTYWGFSPRFALQKVGTECLRNNFDKDIWIKSVEKIVLNSSQNLVITDVRFFNEASAIHNWNGYLIRVDRPFVGASSGIFAHSSETSMEQYREWDYILDNDVDGLPNLYLKVDRMVNFFSGKENGKRRIT